MKYFISAYLLFSLFFISQAQEASSAKNDARPTHRFGIQANHLLSSTLGKSQANGLSPYSFFYKHQLKNKLSFRLGLGGKMKSDKDQLEGFADAKTNEQLGLDLRMGLEVRGNLGEKWSSSLGFDFLGFISRDRNVIKTGFDKVTVQQLVQGVGLGPIFGLEYRFSPKLSIYTETAAYFKTFKASDSREFENFPQQNDLISTITGNELELVLPASIYLVLNF